MKFHLLLWSGFVSMAIALSAAEAACAQMGTSLESDRLGNWQFVEQPLGVKAGMSAIAAGLVGLELWWFLLSGQSGKAKSKENVQLDAIADVDAEAISESEALLLSADESAQSAGPLPEIAIAQGYIDAIKGIAMVEDHLVPRFSAFAF